MRTKYAFLFFAIIFATAGAAHARTITLAVDSRDWVPFTFSENGKMVGMHIDVVEKACKSLGYTLKVEAYPRKRCIMNTERGEVDGMISVSYHPDLQGKMRFPKDAATKAESEWCLMQVDHVLVTPSGSPYDFAGNFKTLPIPVRIPVGETVTLDIRKAGIKVDEAKTDLQNFMKMKRDQNGSVITTTIIAEKMNDNPSFSDQFRIHATPIASQSYFLAFSPKSGLSEKEQQAIWDEIKKWREDYVFMLQVFAQY